MIRPPNHIKEKSIPLSITNTALTIAREFAGEQPTLEKKKQVYLNTLAVCVVNDYMEMMNIATDLESSDSWNRAIRLYTDVADLKLPGLGHLECRQLCSGNFCCIPLDVPDDRIGVVVVELDIDNQQAILIGFSQKTKADVLYVNELQTIDDLLAHIDFLEANQDEVKLNYWLQNTFQVDWQPLEKILVPKTPQLAFRYRSGVTRGKLLDLGIQISGQFVVLVVTLTPKNSVEIQLKLQVHPSSEQTYLPSNLSVNVADENGITVMEAQTTSCSTYITLEFNVQSGQRFSVKLELGDTNITENFVV